MSEEKNILITGGTGNLGCQLLKFLLTERTRKLNLFLLVRAKNERDAERRIHNLFQWLSLNRGNFLSKKIRILIGDVTKRELGLSHKNYTALVRNVDVIYQMAALTRFQDSISKLRSCNITGTKRILDLVLQSKKAIELHYTSTIFVAGTCDKRFSENDLDVGQDFNNPYEQSKFEAEKIVRKFSSGDKKVCIYRPSIVVGDYRTGAINNFQMFYHVLYLIVREVFDEIPVNRSASLNIIPVDIAAKMIILLSKNFKNNATYHIVNPKILRIDILNNIISDYFHIKKPRFPSKTRLKTELKSNHYDQFLQILIGYLRFNAKIECQKTMNTLNALGFRFPMTDEAFIKRLFSYAIKVGYIKLK